MTIINVYGFITGLSSNSYIPILGHVLVVILQNLTLYIRIMNFIHDNFSEFIMTTQDDAFEEQYLKTLGCKPPKKLPYGIVWKGTKMEDDVTTM